MATEVGGLAGEDAQQFEASIQEITRDTPQTQVAAYRISKLLKKAGKGASDAIRDILVDVASETAKKIIWPGS